LDGRLPFDRRPRVAVFALPVPPADEPPRVAPGEPFPARIVFARPDDPPRSRVAVADTSPGPWPALRRSGPVYPFGSEEEWRRFSRSTGPTRSPIPRRTYASRT